MWSIFTQKEKKIEYDNEGKQFVHETSHLKPTWYNILFDYKSFTKKKLFS